MPHSCHQPGKFSAKVVSQEQNTHLLNRKTTYLAEIHFFVSSFPMRTHGLDKYLDSSKIFVKVIISAPLILLKTRHWAKDLESFAS